MVLLAEGIVCHLFCWAMLCDTIPWSVILFWNQSYWASLSSSWCFEESCHFDGISLQQVEEIFLAKVCALPSASEEPSVHKLPGIPNFPPSSEPHSTITFCAAIFLSHINFLWWDHQLFIRLYWWRQFTGGLIGGVYVHIFKMLCLLSTLLTCMQAFPFACWSHVWMSSLIRNSICILKWLVLAGHFLALRYDHMVGTGNAFFTPVWCNKCNCTLYTVHWNVLWHLFITPRC